MKFRNILFNIILLSIFSISNIIFSKGSLAMDDKDILIMRLKDGEVRIQLDSNIAPNHVKRIKELTNKGFYNGVVFHRVIDGFMAQTGDPTGTGMGGSGQNIKAEFSNKPHTRGAISMARAQSPDSADSQFFIVLADSPHLNNQYTIFGYVVSGMEFVDKIKKGDPRRNGLVDDPDRIIEMYLEVLPRNQVDSNNNADHYNLRGDSPRQTQ